MIHVLNIKHDPLPDGWIYIGRGAGGFPESPLHNPWRLTGEADRPALIAKYKRHLWDALRNPRKIEDLLAARMEVFRLARLARKQDVYLGCWCKPAACHGDVVKAAVEWIIANNIEEPDEIKCGK